MTTDADRKLDQKKITVYPIGFPCPRRLPNKCYTVCPGYAGLERPLSFRFRSVSCIQLCESLAVPCWTGANSLYCKFRTTPRAHSHIRNWMDTRCPSQSRDKLLGWIGHLSAQSCCCLSFSDCVSRPHSKTWVVECSVLYRKRSTELIRRVFAGLVILSSASLACRLWAWRVHSGIYCQTHSCPANSIDTRLIQSRCDHESWNNSNRSDKLHSKSILKLRLFTKSVDIEYPLWT